MHWVHVKEFTMFYRLAHTMVLQAVFYFVDFVRLFYVRYSVLVRLFGYFIPFWLFAIWSTYRNDSNVNKLSNNNSVCFLKKKKLFYFSCNESEKKQQKLFECQKQWSYAVEGNNSQTQIHKLAIEWFTIPPYVFFFFALFICLLFGWTLDVKKKQNTQTELSSSFRLTIKKKNCLKLLFITLNDICFSWQTMNVLCTMLCTRIAIELLENDTI